MMRQFQTHFFLCVPLLLGSLIPLTGNAFNFILLAFILLLAWKSNKQFRTDIKAGKSLLLVNAAFFLYFSIQTIIILAKGNLAAKPNYGMFESLLLCFILIPVYVSTWRSWISPRLLQKFLLNFCLGCLALNTYALVHVIHSFELKSVKETFLFLYDTRFAANRPLLGTTLWLEAQATLLAIAAIASYFLFIVRPKHRPLLFLLFIILTTFLSFTMTKSAIIGFILGFILVNIFLWRRLSSRMKIIFSLLAIVVATSCFPLAKHFPKQLRINEIKQEIHNIQEGNLRETGSLAPRIAFLKECHDHRDEYMLWGVGVAMKQRIKAWYEASPHNIAHYSSVNNTFLHYWIMGGIAGLAFVLFWFFAPIVRMFKKGRFSFLVLGLSLVLIVVSNSCVTLAWSNLRTCALMLLSMFYLYGAAFTAQENDVPQRRPSNLKQRVQ